MSWAYSCFWTLQKRRFPGGGTAWRQGGRKWGSLCERRARERQYDYCYTAERRIVRCLTLGKMVISVMTSQNQSIPDTHRDCLLSCHILQSRTQEAQGASAKQQHKKTSSNKVRQEERKPVGERCIGWPGIEAASINTGLHNKALPRFCEIRWISYILFTYCRQENAIFPPLIHTTWEGPYSAALYILVISNYTNPCPALPW